MSSSEVHFLTKSSLVEEVELLPHKERVKCLVGVGHSARTSPISQAVISHLHTGSKYEQKLALYSVHGSRDISLAIEAANSSSSAVRSQALSTIAQYASDEEAVEVALNLPDSVRKTYLKRLRDRRRFTQDGRHVVPVIDRFIDKIQAEGHTALIRQSLFLASASVVERLLPEIANELTSPEWARLIHRCPQDVGRYILSRGTASSSVPHPSLQGSLIVNLAKSVATRKMAMELFETYIQDHAPDQKTVEPLLKLDAKRTIELVLRNLKTVEFKLADYTKLDTQQVIQLLERTRGLNIIYVKVEGMSSDQRVAVFDHFKGTFANNLKIVGLLPAERRISEARRQVKDAKEAKSVQSQIRWASLLPWDEAMETYSEHLKSGEVSTRRLVLEQQIRSVRFDRGRLHEGLALVLRHRNEQELTRRVIHRALGELPPSMWEESHLNIMTDIVRNTLDKADTTDVSCSYLGDALIVIATYHPAWAFAQMALIFRERGALPYNRFPQAGHTPHKDAMRHLIDAFHPLVQEWHEKQETESISLLVKRLGDNIKYYPQLLDILQSCLSSSASAGFAKELVSVLFKHRRVQAQELVRAQIQHDRTWVLLEEPRHFISNDQTQLLSQHRLLEGSKLTGRFEEADDTKRFVFDQNFGKWTQCQHKVYADSIAGELKGLSVQNGGKPFSYRLHSRLAKDLAKLYFADERHLLQFTQDERPVVQQVALMALGRADSADSLGVVLEAMGGMTGDNARYAMIAFRRLLRTTSRERALGVLKDVPTKKVNTAKEVVRAVADLKTQKAYDYLLDIEQRDELHESTHVAVLKALATNYPDRTRTWEVLDSVAASNNTKVVDGLCELTACSIDPSAHSQLASLFAKLLQHTNAAVRHKALKQIYSDKPQTPTLVLARTVVAMLSGQDEEIVRRAALYLFAQLAEMFPELAPEIERELCNASVANLRCVATKATLFVPKKRVAHKEVTHAMLRAMAHEPLVFTLRVRIIADCLPWPDNLQAFQEVLPEMHPDALRSSASYLQTIGTHPDGNLEEFERALFAAGSTQAPVQGRGKYGLDAGEAQRRLGLAALEGLANSPRKWTPELKERLEVYRQDASPWIRELASYLRA
jgi:hypothetical protein